MNSEKDKILNNLMDKLTQYNSIIEVYDRKLKKLNESRDTILSKVKETKEVINLLNENDEKDTPIPQKSEKYLSLKELLKEEILEILYEKKDGTQRKMYVTKCIDFIPDEFFQFSSNSNNKNSQQHLTTVFEVNEKSWKKIKINKILGYGIVPHLTF